jgi:hypothetical protein
MGRISEDLSIVDIALLDRQFHDGKKRVSVNRLTEHAGIAQDGDLFFCFSEVPGNEKDRYLPFPPHDLYQFDAAQSRHSIVGNDKSIRAGLQSE